MKKSFLIISICILASCASRNAQIKGNIQSFVDAFEEGIAKQDSTSLWKLFKDPRQAAYAYEMIKLLENRKSDVITCQPHFKNIVVDLDQEWIRIAIPIDIRPKEAPADTSRIIVWLEKAHGRFVIAKIEGDFFYRKVSYSIFQSQNDQTEKMALEKLRPIFDLSEKLKSNYDSLIWFSEFNNHYYFYVIKGNWNDDTFRKHLYSTAPSLLDKDGWKMGLINEKGDTIVPVDFDKVGTPGIMFPNVIEVKKGKRIGYYGIDGTKLTEVNYTLVIPYKSPESIALVKIDSIEGWLDPNFAFHRGIPGPEAKSYISDFKFLNKQIELSHEFYPIACEPSPSCLFDNETIGYIFPPEYLIHFGLFNPSQQGSNSEFVRKESSEILSVGSSFKLLITNFKQRYLEGRQEFYYHEKLTLVDTQADTLSTLQIASGSKSRFRRISENIFEFSFSDNGGYPRWDAGLLNFPTYRYLAFNDGKLQELNSKYKYPMLQYARLDSTYLEGPFFYQINNEPPKEIDFVSEEFLEVLRIKILALNGLDIHDTNFGEYKPRYEKYEDAYQACSEIEKYNLDFIARLIGPYDPKLKDEKSL